MFLLFRLSHATLNKIPNEYEELASLARARAKLPKLASETEDVLTPGRHSFSGTTFYLSHALTSPRGRGVRGYAFDKSSNIFAIVSSRQMGVEDYNTMNSTFFSLPEEHNVYQFCNLVADDGEVAILESKQIEPMSIFQNLQIHHRTAPVSSSSLKDNGKELFEKFDYNGKCNKGNKEGNCNAYISLNWPKTDDNTKIPDQMPNKQVVTVPVGGKNIDLDTYLGAYAGVSLDYKYDFSLTNANVDVNLYSQSYFVARLIAPETHIEGQDIKIKEQEHKFETFKTTFHQITLQVEATGILGLGLKDVRLNINKELDFSYKAGLELEKHFKFTTKGGLKATPVSSKLEKIKESHVPSEDKFEGNELVFDISESVGVVLNFKVSVGPFGVFSVGIEPGLDFRQRLKFSAEPQLCPAPYLLGTFQPMIYFTFKITDSLKILGFTLLKGGDYSSSAPFWVGKPSKSFCLFSSDNSWDSNQNNFKANTYILRIDEIEDLITSSDMKSPYYLSAVVEKPSDSTFQKKYYSFPPFSFTYEDKRKINHFNSVNVLTYEAGTCLGFDIYRIAGLSKQSFSFDQNCKPLSFVNIQDDIKAKGPSHNLKLSYSLETAYLANINEETKIVDINKYLAVNTEFVENKKLGAIIHSAESDYRVERMDIFDESLNKQENTYSYECKNFWKYTISLKDSINLLVKVYMNDGSNELLGTHLMHQDGEYEQIFEVKNPKASLKFVMTEVKRGLPNANYNDKVTKGRFDTKEFTEKINLEKGNEVKYSDSLTITARKVDGHAIYYTAGLQKGDCIIIAPIVEFENPLSLEYTDGKPLPYQTTISMNKDENYGILKMMFDIDPAKYKAIKSPKINAVARMENIMPLFSFERIGNNEFIIDIESNRLGTEKVNGKDVLVCYLPFRKETDEAEKSIVSEFDLFDVFIPIRESNPYCDTFYTVETVYSFVHSGCISTQFNGNQPEEYYVAPPLDHKYQVSFATVDSPYDSTITWKLYSFMSNADGTESSSVLVRSKLIELPENQVSFSLSEDQTSLISKSKIKTFNIQCPRCGSIDVTFKDDQKDTIERTNSEYFTIDIGDGEYEFEAVCKDDKGTFCKNTITLNDGKPCILNIPRNLAFTDVDYVDRAPLFPGVYQQIVSKPKITLIKNLPLSITFNPADEATLDIIVYGKWIGDVFCVYAESGTVKIPFSVNIFATDNEGFLGALGITVKDQSDFEKIQVTDNIFIFRKDIEDGSVTIDNSYIKDQPVEVDKAKATKIFDLKSVNSLKIIYEKIDNTNQDISEQDYDFCFYDTDDSNCAPNSKIKLDYAKYNYFTSFPDSQNEELSIFIADDIKCFTAPLSDITAKKIVFECPEDADAKKIAGFLSVPPDMQLVFNNVEISNLKLYIQADFSKASSTQRISAGKIDVSNSKGNLDAEVVVVTPYIDNFGMMNSIDIISGIDGTTKKPTIQGGLGKVSRDSDILYTIETDSQHFSLKAGEKTNQQDYNNKLCLYENDPSVCDAHVDMQKVGFKDISLINTLKKQVDSEVLIAVDTDMTGIDIKNILSNTKSVTLKGENELKGTLNLPQLSKITIADEVGFQDMVINQNLLLTDILCETNPESELNEAYLDLSGKLIKDLIIKFDTSNSKRLTGDSYYFKYAKNVNDGQTVTIQNGEFTTDLYKVTINKKVENGEIILELKSTWRYENPNLFCVYNKTQEKCTKEEYRPIIDSEIKSINTYVRGDNDQIEIMVVEDVYIQFSMTEQFSSGINEMVIKGDPNIAISGKITIKNPLLATITGVDVSKLTLVSVADIDDAEAGIFDIKEASGSPQLIKLLQENIPKDTTTWLSSSASSENKENKQIEFVRTKADDLSNILELRRTLIGGGFINSKIISEKIDGNDYNTISMLFTVQAITIEADRVNQFCLYSSDEAKCQSGTIAIKDSDIIEKLGKNLQKEPTDVIIQVVEDANIGDSVSFAKYKGYTFIFIGEHKVTGKMTVDDSVELAFLNPSLVEELEIEILFSFVLVDSKYQAKHGSISLCNGAQPKAIHLKVGEYGKELESQTLESIQYIHDLCPEVSDKQIPKPYASDYLILSRCAHTDGTIGTKLSFGRMTYEKNEFCLYDQDLTKCTHDQVFYEYKPIKLTQFEDDYLIQGSNIPKFAIVDVPKEKFPLPLEKISRKGYDSADLYLTKGAGIFTTIPDYFSLNVKGSLENSALFYNTNALRDQGRVISDTEFGSSFYPFSSSQLIPLKDSKQKPSLTEEVDPIAYKFYDFHFQPWKFLQDDKRSTGKITTSLIGSPQVYDLCLGWTDGKCKDAIDSKELGNYLNHISSSNEYPRKFVISKLTAPSSIDASDIPTGVSLLLNADGKEVNYKPTTDEDKGFLGILGAGQIIPNVDEKTNVNNRLGAFNSNFAKNEFLYGVQVDSHTMKTLDPKSFDINKMPALTDIRLEGEDLYVNKEKYSGIIYLGEYATFSSKSGKSAQFQRFGKDSLFIIEEMETTTSLLFKNFRVLQLQYNGNADFAGFTFEDITTISYLQERSTTMTIKSIKSDGEGTTINFNTRMVTSVLILEGNFKSSGKGEVAAKAIEVKDNAHPTLTNVAVDGKLSVPKTGSVKLDGCSTTDSTEIQIEGSSEPPVTIKGGSVDKIKGVDAVIDEDKGLNSGILIRGFPSVDICQVYKTHTKLVDRNNAAVTGYDLLCSENGEELTFKKKETKKEEETVLPTWAIALIAVACVLVVGAVIAVIVVVVRKKANDGQSDAPTV